MRLPVGLAAALDAAAREDDRTRSQLVRRVLREHLRLRELLAQARKFGGTDVP